MLMSLEMFSLYLMMMRVMMATTTIILITMMMMRRETTRIRIHFLRFISRAF